MYDVTREKTFENLNRWITALKDNAEPDLKIILVGNKVDLVRSNPAMRKVTREEAMKFAKDNDLLFEETSVELAVNVADVFERLLQGN